MANVGPTQAPADTTVKPAAGTDSHTFRGFAYDIPSYVDSCNGKKEMCTADAEGLPSNSEDCGRYEKWISFYTQPGNAREMTFVGSMSIKGKWSGGSCSEKVAVKSAKLNNDGSFTVPANYKGKVRVAVAVRERAVPQQVAVEWKKNVVIK